MSGIDEKQLLRRELLARRKSLGAEKRRQLSAAVCEHAAQSSPFFSARSVALYQPINREVDTGPLIARAFEAGKRVFLPLVDDHELQFIPFGPGDSLETGAFGIPEPVERVDEGLSREGLESLDLMFLPLVGFDRRGGRLGYGGGYYDRALAPFFSGESAQSGREGVGPHGGMDLDEAGESALPVGEGNTALRRPALIGLAYGFQEVPPFERAFHDVPLDAIVTEKGLVFP